MTIVVISKTRTVEDLSIVFPAPGTTWIMVKTVEETESHPGADLYIDLEFVHEAGRIKALSRQLPALVLVNAVVPTLQEISFPFVRINGWPGFLERSIHELAVVDEEMAGRLPGIYAALGRQYHLVPDTPGMISGRILATIINEAYFTWEEEVSTREEIDIAMKLGTNYPLGPFEWGQRIGLEKIGELLTVLSRNNSRYEPARSLLEAVKH